MTEAGKGDDRIIRESGVDARIALIVEPVLAADGYRLVRVRLSGQNGLTLQIMAEREDGTMTVEDCEAVSRLLSPVLDVEDPIDKAYHLEISSPGIDRPLTRKADYADWAGHEARVKLAEEHEGAKQLSGVIEGIKNNIVSIATPKGVREVPFESIASAKLLLTDKLINATAPLSTEGADSIQTEG